MFRKLNQTQDFENLPSLKFNGDLPISQQLITVESLQEYAGILMQRNLFPFANRIAEYHGGILNACEIVQSSTPVLTAENIYELVSKLASKIYKDWKYNNVNWLPILTPGSTQQIFDAMCLIHPDLTYLPYIGFNQQYRTFSNLEVFNVSCNFTPILFDDWFLSGHQSRELIMHFSNLGIRNIEKLQLYYMASTNRLILPNKKYPNQDLLSNADVHVAFKIDRNPIDEGIFIEGDMEGYITVFGAHKLPDNICPFLVQFGDSIFIFNQDTGQRFQIEDRIISIESIVKFFLDNL